MKDEEYIARAIEGCVVGNGSKQISLLIEELGRTKQAKRVDENGDEFDSLHGCG